MRYFTLLSAAATLLAVTVQDPARGAASREAQVRFSNTMPGPDNASLGANGVAIIRDVMPNDMSGYVAAPDSTVRFTLHKSGSDSVLAELGTTLTRGQSYTVTAQRGPSGSASLTIRADSAKKTP